MNKWILLVVVALTSCSCSNKRFSHTKSPYAEPGEYTQGQAVDALLLLDMEIKTANWEVVETEPIRQYVGLKPNTIEFQVWVKVFPYAGTYEVFCTQRNLWQGGRPAPWKFDKCTSPWILKQVDEGTDVLDYVLATQP